MKGIFIAIFGGACITLQGVANTRISQDISTWQTASITQFTGFIMSLLILLLIRDRKWQKFKQVKPLYLVGGAFGAVIIYSNIISIQHIGVTLTISAVLIAQLSLTFLIDIKGWFDVVRLRIRIPQFIGIGIMVVGVVILGF